jgi:hypothetical protein
LLGGLLLANLLAAHIVRFRLTWKRSGVLILHSGLVLLFVGEFITREFAIEQRMTIDEGQTVNYTEDSRKFELAIIDRSDPKEDQITAIPESILRGKGRIVGPVLPFEIEVEQYMTNSALEKPGPGKPNRATAGNMITPGAEQIAVEMPEVSGVEPNQKIDIPSMYVKLFKKGANEPLGTWLLSVWLKDDHIEIDGKKYYLSFRFKRYYKPYSVKLIDFRFDRYIGTEKPKNYSSQIILNDSDMGIVNREQTIRMNEPMRHRGETFYQSNFMNEGTRVETTVLQVVRNPGWLIPYISCILVSVGMLLHFGIYLNQFLTRRAAA